MTEPEELPWTRKLAAFLMLVAMVGGIGALAYTGCVETAEVQSAGDAYVEALRAGDLDRAYSMLATETKQDLSRQAFERSIGTPELARSTSHGWGITSAGSAGVGCLSGGVTVDGESESLTLYMWREGDRWTVHTVAYDLFDHSNMPWRCD